MIIGDSDSEQDDQSRHYYVGLETDNVDKWHL